MRPDLIVREITNGMWFILPLCMAIVFAIHVFKARKFGWTIFAEASLLFSVFLISSVIMRGWIWAVLWTANHGYEPMFRDDYWLAIFAVIIGMVSGLRLIFILTPQWENRRLRHWPWLASFIASTGLPIGAYFIGFWNL